jgi:glycosyltransferase involved in cell wall biosynthesis
MNILHISPRLRPGGINQLAADLAAGLQQVGFRNAVMAPPNELVGRMTAASVQHHSCRALSLFTYFSQIKRLRRVIQSTKAHVILAYTTQAACMAWKVCMELPQEKRPCIIGIHTTYPKHLGWAAALDCCDATVAISTHLRNELIRRAKLSDERNIWVIPYGVNEELCNPDYRPAESWMEQWKKSCKHSEGTLSICIPGAITPLHGLDDLPAILARLEQIKVPVHVYIAGDTARADHKYLSSIRRALKESKTEHYVSWIGARNDLRDVMSACDMVLSLARMPASHDRVILEALALGKPVAGYDHGAVGEMLDTFLAEGRVAPGDIAGIADRIEQWHAYLPPTEATLPHPYRLGDTIRSIAELCTAVSEGRKG